MASQSVLELAVNTGKWDSGLKKAKSALDNFTTASGGLQQALGKDADKMQKFVQMMGSMESKAKTAKGQMSDYKSTIEQLTMQYNRMTEAQKKTIGQDYLRAIDQLRQKYQAVNQEVQQMNRSLTQTPSTPKGGGFLSDLGGKFGGALQVFGGNLLTKGAGMLAGLASEMGDMVKQGVELARQGEGIRIAFERLGRGDILDGLRQATHGTVTDLELMKAAVKFNDFKLPVEELGTMLAFAQQKAKDTGQSVDYMVDSIVTGLGRKSLMILDNLGLSANEIKEKMKDTGDMTKAVGAIIREQMAKSGDYVETAADRATKADVELKNAMEDLGRTFQPLSEAGTSLWNKLKIGALDLLNNAVRPLIDALTEAGRIRSKYAQQGGDRRVNGFLDTLKGISSDDRRRDTYNRQLAKFDSKIGSYQQYLEDYKAQQEGIRKGNPNLAAGDRVMAFQKQTGLSFFSDVKEQLAVFQKQRAEYVMGAKAILEGIPAPSPADSSDGKGGKGGKTGTNINYATDSIMAQQAEVSRLTKLWQSAGAVVRDDYKAQLDEAQYLLDRMTGKEKFDPTKMGELRDLRGTTAWASSSLFTAGTAPVVPDTIKFSDSLAKRMEYEEKQRTKDIEKPEANLLENTQDLIGGLSSVASGLSQMGIELPDGVQKVLGGMQGLMSVIQGVQTILNIFTTTTTSAQMASLAANSSMLVANTAALSALTGAIATNTVTNLFPLANGGVVKAASGYRVPGRTFSGDMIPARLNAGELVLNQAQAGVIANALQDRDFSGGSGMMQPYVDGEKIFLGMNNTSKRMGRGEIVTTGTLRRLGLI